MPENKIPESGRGCHVWREEKQKPTEGIEVGELQRRECHGETLGRCFEAKSTCPTDVNSVGVGRGRIKGAASQNLVSN